MEIERLVFPTPLEEIQDIGNDNLDVLVELEDGNTYTLVVITPKNIELLIGQNNKEFLEAGPPMIIVKELKYSTIYSAINSFCADNAYWLKEYYLSGEFDIHLLNDMIKIVHENKS